MDGDETGKRADAILDAAEALIRSEGVDGWSVADLADRAGMSVEEVEAEIESEWEAFCRVIRRDEARFEAAIRSAPYRDQKERFMRLLEECVPDFDWTFWIELWSLALREQAARDLREALDDGFRALIEEFISDGVETGEFAVADTPSAAITIATLIDAMALQATLGDTTVRPNYMFDACVAVAGTLLGTELRVPKLEGDPA